ncbi:MAG: hypothetical protein H7Z42_05520, partial [Roseiflexaceae bacterium]|nr:hypothetical protein [Roseiflexaceae bacterium]
VSRDLLRAMTAELEASADHRRGENVKPFRLAALSAFPAGKSGARLAAKIEPQAGCPMCAARPQIEQPLIAGLLQNLDDPAFVAAFEVSEGLCRNHVASALRAADSAAAQQLATLQAQRWRAVEAVLDEFIRKHDYRFNEDMSDDERTIWLRALRLSSGWLGEVRSQ